MKLIVQYFQGSVYEGSTVTFPAEYESAEALYCAIEDAYKKARTEGKSSFTVGGYVFDTDDLCDRDDRSKFTGLDVLTVEEWFMQPELQG